ncbi:MULTISPECIES: peptidylprolyl isomerase [Helcococcus]|uniref:Peptidyl-prolyl cis-trans isomerase n=1 Tax=Helcococcus bovis TaxID=3153252 RepID=A0ABW9F4R5_9FIRM
MKKILILLLCLIFMVGCTKKVENKNFETKSEKTKSELKKGDTKVLNQVEGYQEGNIKAKIKTNMGEMELILFPKVAPKAVENFVKHAKDGYYEGIIFHRVIEGFMIQGGDPTGTGRGGESIWKKSFEDEFDVNYRNFYGALSMANAGPNTNGSQFFIVTAKNNINDNLVGQMKKLGEKGGFPDSVIDAYKNLGGTPHLDGRHTVFGHVVKGMDVAEKISKVERDAADKPVKDVVIEKITIEE